jgi:hypothetical protein
VSAPADRDYNEEGIEMFVALEGVPGAPAARREADAALARLAASYLREPGGLEEVAEALERLAADHFELGA